MATRRQHVMWTHAPLLWSVFLTIGGVNGANQTDHYRLLDTLLTTYRNDIRPLNENGYATDVYVLFDLLSVLDVNEGDQTLITNAMLTIYWYDEYLSWDISEYGDVDNILLPQGSVWLPDIVVDKTTTPQTQLGYDTFQLRVYSIGLVIWNPSGVFKTACDIDITFYPFDTQVCSLVFKTAVTRSSEISIRIAPFPIDISNYSENGLWELLNTSASSFQESNGQQRIEFNLELKRRSIYYILKILLPLMFLSLTSSLVFALPAESCEKMSLSITVLLAYAVYLTIVTNTMPSTSANVSILTLYVLILLFFTAAGVVLSVWILSLHHRPDVKPVTGFLAKVTVSLRKALHMSLSDVNIGSEGKSDLKNGDILKAKKNVIVPLTSEVNHNITDENVTAVTECSSLKSTATIRGRVVAETFDKLFCIVLIVLTLGVTVVTLAILLVGSSIRQSNMKLTS